VAALLTLTLGNLGVNVLWVVVPSRFIFYYVIWRLPLFFGLVLAMRAAGTRTAHPEAKIHPA
jgi:hypothetical protein